MGVQEDFPSQQIERSTEKQLIDIKKRFMNQEGQLWKIGLFLGYNALALYSMNRYVRHFVISRRKSTKTKLSKTQIKKRFGFDKVLKKGSVYGLMMGGLYISGLLLIGYYVLPLSTFRKYCELQAAEYSYSIIHNPQYQKMLVIDKMRSFNFSEKLIQQVIQQLQNNKLKAIQQNSLTESTLHMIKQAEQKMKQQPYGKWIK